ncbi:hypothetical protein [Comamonas resistens]|uniref:Uncharacterized protein n=1 Tax=Comamonas resistens TaxID=3046670 RepID=A0ABY8SRE6_9BURK|nr:hypothetical protein [Comamonas resistens]MDL5037184.1 hypothetical protein [Comamonas resistens]WHS65620.1 hypothetical protein QMY55_00205 [Comamonas resistens]
MKKVQHKLWHHCRDTPFEVMSVILFSALTFGSAGAAMAHHSSSRDDKVHRIQTVLSQHAHGSHSAKPAPAQQG